MSSSSVVATGAQGAREGGKRARRSEIDGAITAAVRKILAEKGYDGLTFDAIAREAGVSRPTLYRRWPNKARLLEDFAYAGEDRLPTAVATANLRAAIMAILRQVADYYMAPWMRPATLGILASGVSDDPFPPSAARTAEIAARTALASLVEDAKAKGMMRKDVDAEALYDLVIGSVLYRTLFSHHGVIDDDRLACLLDIILDGIAVGGDAATGVAPAGDKRAG